ncbi:MULTISPECIES: hypothetical protein [unclassified Tolypothrix]|uniref:hypothetical protein n=1 Tax=unclassified Tolypothrix TaxID=2649714 RepID=UPI000AEC2C77|nr:MULTISPECIES: hypothetical protein [unclassified Tolypothrix]MBE9085118.1 hypothetical protein [Tolypothrix sp. LEGE 11397]UYD28366.1 hypothetical protein HGR01_10190 [Tolypothrix sp. PCC 7712]UYD35756.1 hypothetical protein HG267_08375 [Tolypothrix sp. PCC 7601]BAY94673.1 hypothetical protein NIES3275_67250 [Microchaete diplosiphon NIES-3275]
MTNTPTNSKTQGNQSPNKKQQSFPKVDIGSPRVPLKKRQTKPQQHELLSDWEHAS